MLAKDEPDCEAGDQVSESNYDDGHHAGYKSSLSGMGDDGDSDNEASNDQRPLPHSLSHHLRSGVKLEAALMEFSEGLNLINKPNINSNDDNNNTSSSYNSATTNLSEWFWWKKISMSFLWEAPVSGFPGIFFTNKVDFQDNFYFLLF